MKLHPATANLPIIPYLPEIAQAMQDHPVVIIKAETGSGKTTCIPPYLAALGQRVLVTQPRRIAAISVAEYVAQLMGCEVGTEVGYRVKGERRDNGKRTRVLFVTDGLGLKRQLGGHNSSFDVVFVDEVHEFNEFQEVMLMQLREELRNGATFKVVLSSATLEAERLSQYFDNAPIIEVPGRLFDVESRPKGKDKIDDIVGLALEGRNVLVFEPGIAEIKDTIRQLEDRGIDAEIIPLHGELSKDEQAKCFGHYGRVKIVVATNIAQTSITIDDIDAVVDSGTVKVKMAVGYADSLMTIPTSLAEADQRKGRAGRTKPGIYIDHCPFDRADRAEFPIAEIMRVQLDRMTLHLLAQYGIDIEQVEFVHQPEPSAIQAAKRSLWALGFLNTDGTVSADGEAASQLDVSPQIARMVLEARKHHVVRLISIVGALLEQQRIVRREKGRDATNWLQKLAPRERSSDVLASVVAYMAAEGENNQQKLFSLGYDVKRLMQTRVMVRDLQKHLRDELAAESDASSDLTDPATREAVLKSICAGMIEHLFIGEFDGNVRDPRGDRRQVPYESVIDRHDLYGRWLVGKRFDISDVRRTKLLTHASVVDPQWLPEVAPHLAVVIEDPEPFYDPNHDGVFTNLHVLFNGIEIMSNPMARPDHPTGPQVFAQWLANKGRYTASELADVLWHNQETMVTNHRLLARTQVAVGPVWTSDQLAQHYLEATGGNVTSLKALTNPDMLRLPAIDTALLARCVIDYPDEWRMGGLWLRFKYEVGALPTASVYYDPSLFWSSVPETTLRLPVGQTFSLTVQGQYWTVSDTDGGTLRNQVLAYALEELWQQFQRRSAYVRDAAFPAIFPLNGDDHSPAEHVYESPYGVHPLTGQSMTAYAYYQFTDGNILRVAWTRDLRDAIVQRDRSMRALQVHLDATREARKLEKAHQLLLKRLNELDALRYDAKYAELPAMLYDHIESLRVTRRYSTLADYQQHINQLYAAIQQLNTELASLHGINQSAPDTTVTTPVTTDDPTVQVDPLHGKLHALANHFRRR